MTDYNNGPLTTDGIEDSRLPPPPAPEETPPPASRLSRGLKTAAWTAFGLFCLIVFTLLKLPDERIQAYVQGTISAMLAPKGITFTAEKGYVSVGLGVSYVMKNIVLTLPPPMPPAKLDKVTVTPSLIPMIFGYQGGSFAITQGESRLKGSFSMKGRNISASMDAKQVDLGKTGALALLGVKASGVLSGNLSVSGDFSIPSTLNGDADLTLSKVVLEPQTLVFINIPRVSISEGRIDISADKGKATIKTLQLGKPGSADDLQGKLTGDIMLGRSWDSSTLNAKANFKLSDPLMRSLILLDAFLGPGKQGDGSYSLTLTGPLTLPNAVPLAPGVR